MSRETADVIEAGSWGNVPDGRDVQAIQNLLQMYALACDAGRASDLAPMFTPDAVWDGTGLGFVVAEGPGQIGDAVVGHFDPARPMMHLPGPAVLTAVADAQVRAVSWCLATRWTDGEIRPHIHFYYDDELVRGADGTWRFRSRRLRPAFPTATVQ